jgi:hypothetical protein
LQAARRVLMDRLRGLSIWGECRLDFETMHHEQRNHMTS